MPSLVEAGGEVSRLRQHDRILSSLVSSAHVSISEVAITLVKMLPRNQSSRCKSWLKGHYQGCGRSLKKNCTATLDQGVKRGVIQSQIYFVVLFSIELIFDTEDKKRPSAIGNFQCQIN